MKEFALIVAGGSGKRMKAEIPKQFIELAGKPILMHTINAFHIYSSNLPIYVVIPEDYRIFWETQCLDYKFNVPHHIVKGGESRFQSVKNGLNEIEEEGIIAIHDGVRPLITPEIIKTSFLTAAQTGSAVAAVESKDSLRMVEQGGNKAIDRTGIRLIQTPQTFRSEILQRAYATQENAAFTDDATVVEKAGNSITLIEGSYENIKITTYSDLKIAALLLSEKS